MATPRTIGRQPSQRLRPALPIEMFAWSGLETAPIGRHAAAVHQPLLARIEPQDRVALVAADDLGVGAGGARHLAALAGLHLDIVDDRADRHGAQRHGVARLHVDLLAGDDRVAGRQTLRREDVGDARRPRSLISAMKAVRFGSYSSRSTVAGDVELAALEVDDAVASACGRRRDGAR